MPFKSLSPRAWRPDNSQRKFISGRTVWDDTLGVLNWVENCWLATIGYYFDMCTCLIQLRVTTLQQSLDPSTQLK